VRQREVQDGDNVRWVCVQAFGGGSGDTAEEAAEKLEDHDGRVPVVCTPSGGAQTVRIELARGWEDEETDEELLARIAGAR
jgi:hypothetical protein